MIFATYTDKALVAELAELRTNYRRLDEQRAIQIRLADEARRAAEAMGSALISITRHAEVIEAEIEERKQSQEARG